MVLCGGIAPITFSMFVNGQWVATSAGAGSSTTVTISENEPTSPTAADLCGIVATDEWASTTQM